MVIFNSFLYVYQAGSHGNIHGIFSAPTRIFLSTEAWTRTWSFSAGSHEKSKNHAEGNGMATFMIHDTRSWFMFYFFARKMKSFHGFVGSSSFLLLNSLILWESNMACRTITHWCRWSSPNRNVPMVDFCHVWPKGPPEPKLRCPKFPLVGWWKKRALLNPLKNNRFLWW